MKSFLCLSILATFLSCANASPIEHNSNLVDYLNGVNKTWKAGNKLAKTEDEFRKLCGTRLGHVPGYPEVIAQRRSAALPDSFDARQKWPQCKLIGAIRDQACCGSCWAVATAEVATDRACIHSGAEFNAALSSEDIIDCCSDCGNGCFGGYPLKALGWWKSNGIVTGGDYGSHMGCKPYNIRPACEVPPETTCRAVCEVGYQPSYEKDKHFAATAYQVGGTEENIRQEIFDNGPVVASFLIYGDFAFYESGVYQHVPGSAELGGHSVKIIGWGVEQDVPYWLVANSWNATWGENGFFKIRRGNNECDFEKYIVAGIPKKPL